MTFQLQGGLGPLRVQANQQHDTPTTFTSSSVHVSLKKRKRESGEGTSTSSSVYVSPKKRKRESGEGEEEIITMSRLEHERRMDIMLKEHQEKMEIYALKKEILQAQIREQNADQF